LSVSVNSTTSSTRDQTLTATESIGKTWTRPFVDCGRWHMPLSQQM